MAPSAGDIAQQSYRFPHATTVRGSGMASHLASRALLVRPFLGCYNGNYRQGNTSILGHF